MRAGVSRTQASTEQQSLARHEAITRNPMRARVSHTKGASHPIALLVARGIARRLAPKGLPKPAQGNALGLTCLCAEP